LGLPSPRPAAKAAPSTAPGVTRGKFRLCKLFRGYKIAAKMLNAKLRP
jgi:hypothetical protein